MDGEGLALPSSHFALMYSASGSRLSKRTEISGGFLLLEDIKELVALIEDLLHELVPEQVQSCVHSKKYPVTCSIAIVR
jgi:hypothetical protein